jgi:hypothetical protein
MARLFLVLEPVLWPLRKSTNFTPVFQAPVSPSDCRFYQLYVYAFVGWASPSSDRSESIVGIADPAHAGATGWGGGARPSTGASLQRREGGEGFGAGERDEGRVILGCASFTRSIFNVY